MAGSDICLAKIPSGQTSANSCIIPSHFVQFLVLFQFFLFTLKRAQPIIDVLQQFLDLFALSL